MHVWFSSAQEPSVSKLRHLPPLRNVRRRCVRGRGNLCTYACLVKAAAEKGAAFIHFKSSQIEQSEHSKMRFFTVAVVLLGLGEVHAYPVSSMSIAKASTGALVSCSFNPFVVEIKREAFVMVNGNLKHQNMRDL